jgi:hypothetical protein
VEDALRDLD